MNELVGRLKEFVESEMRSCSMDIGGITPKYVQRAWGGRVAIEDIEKAMSEVKRMMEDEDEVIEDVMQGKC